MSSTQRTGEPRLAAAASWAVLAASFGLSAATWIALARLAGFDNRVVLAGVVAVSMAWLMPIAVDGYIVVALVLWMAPVPAKVAAFAKRNTYGAALVGVAAQSAYHALTVLAATGVVWRCVLAAVVGALPPGVAALAVHMRALIRRETGQPAATRPATTAGDQPVDPQVAELCETVRRQARAARIRVGQPQIVHLGPRLDGRPAVPTVAARPAVAPPAHAATSRPAADSAPATPTATEAERDRPATGRDLADQTAADATTEPAIGEPGGGQEDAEKPAKRQKLSREEVAARVARMVARKPATTAAEVMKRFDLPERSARRYLSKAREAVESSVEGR